MGMEMGISQHETSATNKTQSCQKVGSRKKNLAENDG